MRYFIGPRQGAQIIACAVCLTSMVALPSANANVLLIDDFSATAMPSPWPTLLSGVDSAIVTETGLGSSVLGGTRRTVLQSNGPGSVAAVMGVGIFDYASNTNTSGSLTLTYDATPASTGLNLNASMLDAMMIDFSIYSPFMVTTMPVTMTLDDGNTSTSVSKSLTASGAQTLSFDTDSFAGLGSMGMINSISIEFLAPVGADFRVDQIYAMIPAPGALAMFALAGLCGTRRRRRS
jgi:hypothetical protein